MSFPLPCPDGILMRTIQDGTLSPERDAELEEHLKDCAQCRAVLDMILTPDEPIPGSDGPQESSVEPEV